MPGTLFAITLRAANAAEAEDVLKDETPIVQGIEDRVNGCDAGGHGI